MNADRLYERNVPRSLRLAEFRGPEPDIRHVVIDQAGPHPSTANGIHHVARRIAREQIAAGDRARIIFLRPGGQEAIVEDSPIPTRTLALEGPRLLGHIVGLVPEIIDALVEGADANTIFHIHTARQPLLLSLTRALTRRGFPFAITVHGRYSHVVDRDGRILNRKSALYLQWIESRALERARFVQAVSREEAEVIRRMAPRARISVTPNAAYSSALDGVPPPPRRLRPSADFPVFGFCGRYEIVHKGLDLLIEGFAIYRARGGTGRLVLIGTGPLRSVLSDMVRSLGLESVVEVHGPRFDKDKQRALQSWDFFVQSSRFDGVPIAAIEAALVGLPLIVSRETGLASETEEAEAGVVIDELTPEAVAAALRKASATTPAAWHAMTLGAHGMAVKIGDWTPIAGRLRQLYRRP